jgi:hypothetical protein
LRLDLVSLGHDELMKYGEVAVHHFFNHLAFLYTFVKSEGIASTLET